MTDFKAPATPPKSGPDGQASAGAAAGGLKIVSEVMDSSYKVFDGLGRLWQRGQPEAEKTSQVLLGSSNSSNVVTKMEEMKNQVVNRVRTLSSATESELKTMPRISGTSGTGSVAGASLRQNSVGSNDAWRMPRLGSWKADDERYCKVRWITDLIY